VIITDLLGARVFGPDFLGFVSDARFSFDTESIGQPARLYGLIVSPHARSSELGFERSGVRSPWPIAALVRWRHRGSFLVRWGDIERIDVARIRLREGFERGSPELPRS
jgi:hypothetical protein